MVDVWSMGWLSVLVVDVAVGRRWFSEPIEFQFALSLYHPPSTYCTYAPRMALGRPKRAIAILGA